MQLHHLQPKTKFRKGRRIGRGGKRGTTSGRGTKGQKARAGHKIRPALRDILKKIPKRRGFKFKSFRPKPSVINLDAINEHFSEGDSVTPETLAAKGLIAKTKGRLPAVKILGDGELKKKLVFKDVEFSASAREKSNFVK
ncbi:MAG: 50S ribosomal protein L15 [Candidatus Sungbacteria bacterium RIFCSPLOWO2_01_FULL_47_10]|uniref:Large ribosomal subunit protein uL15 n=1 Tax=Candidatus Sungbacteria bacterium RIFCSPLOWO2_01_FULL_47_10 TaxID=1802276 RepID=A0A1G2L857_9BACT|nr:MAG: 50S ribosomal protein L15 [Candidatus Sungbacteria bacterium RIFCSPLOWO2_01_FULL_47_10]